MIDSLDKPAIQYGLTTMNGHEADILENLLLPVFCVTLAGEIFYVNQAVCIATDFTQNEIIGQMVQCIDNSLTDDLWQDLALTIKAENKLEYESYLNIKTGGEIAYKFFFQYRNAEGNSYILLLCTNIEEQKKMEADIIAAREEALVKSKMLREKTTAAEDALAKVKALKDKQDGDYFLTAKLLEPFLNRPLQGKNISIEYHIRQKTRFKYKHWDVEIGGDIVLWDTVYLKEKPYTFFMLADAMGKAIQGASGALIVATIVHNYLLRTGKAPHTMNLFPERWLRLLHEELHAGFAGFNHAMMISAIWGLLDETTGWVYFCLAEQPTPLTYYRGKARFVAQVKPVQKIGMQKDPPQTYVNLYRLQASEKFIIYSDGLTDIRTGLDGSVNEDPDFALMAMEQAQGKINSIFNSISEKGTVIDDYSILGLAISQRKKISNLEIRQLADNISAKLATHSHEDAALLLEEYVLYRPDHPKGLYLLCRELYNSGKIQEAVNVAERLTHRWFTTTTQNVNWHRKTLDWLCNYYKTTENPRYVTIQKMLH